MKQLYKIAGMHCRSCELRVEKEIEKIPEVNKVKVNFRTKQATIYSQKVIDSDRIRVAIEMAGYKLGEDKEKPLLNTNLSVYRDLAVSLAIIVIFYFIAKSFGLFNFTAASLDKPSNFVVIFLIGITAGLSTCMAMVGGLILGVSARHAEKNPTATPLQNFRPHLFFNLGRIGSYFLLGGLIGMLGKAIQFSGITLGILTIIVGAVMLFLGLQLTEIFPRLQNFSLTLPTSISRFFGIKNREQKEYSHMNAAILGGLTFFLPCGFTQAMQLYAISTGSFLTGGLVMATFALGTAPGLLSIGGLTSFLKGIWANRFFRFVGLAVIILAIFNISNGFNLTGLSPKFSSNSNGTNGVTIENGVQIVRMDQTSSGYSPNNFTIKAGIPVKWLINAKDTSSCSSSIYSSKLGLKKLLTPGENQIDFTVSEIGQFQFSCSMGMYRGYFNVIANPDIQKSSAATTNANNQNQIKANDEAPTDNVQIIKTTYTRQDDIEPNSFDVKINLPVRFEVSVQDDGSGCMSSITIPKLVKNYEILQKDKNIVFNFTPDKLGSYNITCAMGVPRGTINVIN